MPKKSARTPRLNKQSSRQRKTSSTPSFEKIELEAGNLRKDILSSRLAKLLMSKDTFTKGEFVRYFAVPFVAACILALIILFQTAEKKSQPIVLKQEKSVIARIIEVPARLLGGKKVFQGSSVYDPYLLKLAIDKGDSDFLLVDIRSRAEYRKEHIRGAINVPAYESLQELNNLSLSEKQIRDQIRSLSSAKKAIVLYGHTRDSQLTRDVANVVRNTGREVSVLGVGWNEWRHFRNLWLPEPEWDDIQIERYFDSEQEQ